MASLDFNADSYSLSELLGNGRRLFVPKFQRSYAWSDENWQELWLDLQPLRQSSAPVHFMGSVVFRPLDSRTMELIDGQQRITTCLLLILAAIEHLKQLEANKIDPQAGQRAELLHSQYVSFISPGALTRNSKLTLNKFNDGFFQTHLINFRDPSNLRKEPKSNRLIWEAFQFFKDQIARDAELSSNGSALATFIDEVVARKLVFIGIEVADHLSAFRVFETLNARGVRLSPSDLIKNWLFSQFQAESDQNYAEQLWDRVLEMVPAEKFTAFLRHYFCMFELQVRAQDLFEMVQRVSPTPALALSFLNRLESEASRYAALSDSEHEIWATNPDARASIFSLRLFGATQIFPALLAAIPSFSDRELTRLLRVAVNQTFRYNVAGRLSTHAVEPIFNRAAKAIREKRILRASEVYAMIQGIYPDDLAFESSFRGIELELVSKRRLVGYILIRIENHLSGQNHDQNAPDWSVEHIESVSSGEDWVSQMGNMIPLESYLNKKAANKPFAEKRSIYRQSRFQLAKLVAEYEHWDRDSLRHFQARLAKSAVAIWRDDFET